MCVGCQVVLRAVACGCDGCVESVSVDVGCGGRVECSGGVDVIVADKHMSNATLTLAKRQQIPVVTSEWVVQCLIAGRRLPFDGHPRYLLTTAE